MSRVLLLSGLGLGLHSEQEVSQFDGHRQECFSVVLCLASWWSQSSAECIPVAEHHGVDGSHCPR